MVVIFILALPCKRTSLSNLEGKLFEPSSILLSNIKSVLTLQDSTNYRGQVYRNTAFSQQREKSCIEEDCSDWDLSGTFS